MIILGIMIGLILVLPITIIVMVSNRKKLKEMEQEIERYEKWKQYNTTVADWQERRKELIKKLIEIKSKISPSDKKSMEKARDLLASVN